MTHMATTAIQNLWVIKVSTGCGPLHKHHRAERTAASRQLRVKQYEDTDSLNQTGTTEVFSALCNLNWFKKNIPLYCGLMCAHDTCPTYYVSDCYNCGHIIFFCHIC